MTLSAKNPFLKALLVTSLCAISGGSLAQEKQDEPPVVLETSSEEAAKKPKAQPIAFIQPIYPRGAAARGTEGYCVTEFTVLANGRVAKKSIKIKKSVPKGVFDKACIKAASKVIYKPIKVDGKAIALEKVSLRYDFKLSN